MIVYEVIDGARTKPGRLVGITKTKADAYELGAIHCKRGVFVRPTMLEDGVMISELRDGRQVFMREDGRVLADRFTSIDGRTDKARYSPTPLDRAHPYDPDRERTLKSGECFARMTPNGNPVQFNRVWTTVNNIENEQ